MKFPVYLINLDRQPGRLTFMMNQLSQIGVSPIRVSAVDGSKIKNIRSVSAVAPYADMTNSEIACFESHRKIWRRIVEENLKGAFVIEDDVVLSSDFSDLGVDEASLDNIDLIKMDQALSDHNLYGTNEIKINDSRSIVRMVGTEISTGSYFISGKAAKFLLDATNNYILPVDTMMFNVESALFWKMKVWKMKDAVAIQMHMLVGQSELTGDFVERIQQGAKHNTSIPLSEKIANIVKKFGVKVHRVLTNDTRSTRLARSEHNKKSIAENEPLIKENIEFTSPSNSHYLDLIKD